jgi:hypothetical protein
LKLDWLDSLEATGRKITIDRGLDGGGPLVDLQVDGWPIDTATVRGDPANGDPYAFVISANIRRRHLTAEQKRDLIAKVLKAQPRKSNRQIAKAPAQAIELRVSAARCCCIARRWSPPTAKPFSPTVAEVSKAD